MQTINEISFLPTTIREASGNTHESIMRAWNILEKVKDYLRRGVPQDVILELISDMEGKPSSVYVSE